MAEALLLVETYAIIAAILLILAIVIRFYLADVFYSVACDKGYDSRKFFWIPFLFGVIGFILVAALPDRRDEYDLN